MKNFADLRKRVSEHVHTEDDGLLRIVLASLIATRMKLGEPVWMLVVGQSSGGKSQLLRPLALTDDKFIHRVDDLTENTLLSGMGGGETSLLKRIGSHGIIVISDLTVLFSKNAEARAAILAQLRMVYDGEMVKHSGNRAKPIFWKGSVGILAGSTPSVYSHFEEVADMGERFVCYRMKAYDMAAATRRSLDRRLFGRELDQALADLYGEYVQDVVQKAVAKAKPEAPIVPPLSRETEEKLLKIALFAARLRTPAHYDKWMKAIDRVPITEAPMRIALQLRSVALGLSAMRFYDTKKWELAEEDFSILEWCAYSLGNEERRACLRVLSGVKHGEAISTQVVADTIGLPTSVTGIHLQHLAAIGIVERSGTSNTLAWNIKEVSDHALIRRLEGEVEDVSAKERERVEEEGHEESDPDDWGAFNEDVKKGG